MNGTHEINRGQVGSHQSTPRQLTLTEDRGQLFALLQRVHLGGPSHKAFLFALALHPEVWSGRPVRCTYRELARSIDVGIKSAYRIAQKLDALGVLVRIHERWKPPTFAICWANLAALDEEQTHAASSNAVDALCPRSERPES